MSTEELLEGLTEAQREAVVHGAGPLLVLAGPGSGKTRVITHRAAYLARTVTRAEHILAITFTNKAAGEMAERLNRLGVGGRATCSTFHSFCARLLRVYADRAGLRPNYSIFDVADQKAAVKEAMERLRMPLENFPPARALDRISRAKNDMLSPEAFAERAAGAGWINQRVAALYTAYQEVLAEQNALDFDDLLVRAAGLLGEDVELRDQLQDRYRYVLVDEYQDTNHAQYLIARGLSLDHENLCVTGDPDQSIYGWRGANIQNILQFKEDFPRAKVVLLEENYRSTPQILAAADGVIRNNRQRHVKALFTENEGGEKVRVAECEDAGVEAAFIAGRIRDYVERGGRYGDVAVFYRVNALSRSIEAALRDAQIPYQIARGVAFYQRKEIKDVLAYLKVAVNPQDRVALARGLSTPSRGVGKTTLGRLFAQADATGRTPRDLLVPGSEIPGTARAISGLQRFGELIDKVERIAQDEGVAEALRYLVPHSGLEAMWHQAGDQEAMENVNELINAAAEYDGRHERSTDVLTDWLTQISLVSDVDSVDPEIGAVTLMTLHAAKGLEFDVVFMAGIEHGLMPHHRSVGGPGSADPDDEGDRDDVEEERRLCFVGMTRARRLLTMSFARWRALRGHSERTSRSVFLKELPADGTTWLQVGEDGRAVEGRPGADEPGSGPDRRSWQRGQFVRHPSYGVGRVVWIQSRSRQTHAGIHFANGGERTFVLEKAATLTVIDPDEIGEIEESPF